MSRFPDESVRLATRLGIAAVVFVAGVILFSRILDGDRSPIDRTRAEQRKPTIGRLDDELDKLQRVPLLIVDEVGYIPFAPQAANLMFMLVSRRYERASLIVTSNKPFSGWGEIFGDEVTATAMIDRLVHHAEILSLKGDSYRLKDRDLARPPRART